MTIHSVLRASSTCCKFFVRGTTWSYASPRAVKILSRTPNRVIETSCGNRWLENSTDAVGRTLRPVVTDGPLLPIELYHLTAR